MKYYFSTMLLLLVPSPAQTRIIAFWPYQKLVDSSDLVAIVEVTSVEKTNVVWQDRGDAKRFQGYVAHADVAWVIKGAQKPKKIDLVFFKYAETPGVQIEDNGALFVDFRDTDKHQYLVFLRKGAGESFIPTTGHYDASISVKQIKNDGFSRPDGK